MEYQRIPYVFRGQAIGIGQKKEGASLCFNYAIKTVDLVFCKSKYKKRKHGFGIKEPEPNQTYNIRRVKGQM
jgi:hypothetical protein